MGTSTNAYLAFGYDLGHDGDWRITEVDEDGRPSLDWLQDEGDLAGDAIVRLARLRGHDVEFSDQAEEALGFELLHHRHGEHPMYVLAAKVVRAWRGDVVPIDFAELERERVEQEWDRQLTEACQVIGITPKQGKPRWVLCSYWSG